MVSLCDSDVKRLVAIFAHELIELLLDEIHFKFIIINKLNSSTSSRLLKWYLPKWFLEACG